MMIHYELVYMSQITRSPRSRVSLQRDMSTRVPSADVIATIHPSLYTLNFVLLHTALFLDDRWGVGE